jgi:hypothetical protein
MEALKAALMNDQLKQSQEANRPTAKDVVDALLRPARPLRPTLSVSPR